MQTNSMNHAGPTTSMKQQSNGFLSSFSCELRGAFERASHVMAFEPGAVLTHEGEMPQGAYVLCSGSVKLSSTSRDGKTVIIRVAKSGEVIGLSALICQSAHETTAEALMPATVRFINKQDLLHLMQEYTEFSMHAAQAMSREFQLVCREMRQLALAPTRASRLAGLVLSWCPAERTTNEVRIKYGFTHEQIGEMIGTSRETVSRIISEFRREKILQGKGATLIVNVPALEAIAV